MAPGLAALVTVILLVLGVAPLCAGSPGRYDDFRHGVYLPYLDAPGPKDDIVALPHLRISFGGRGYGVVMDTGSTGVVVSADKIPNIDGLQSLGPGKLTYSSSGRIMTGRWVVTPVTVSGADGTSVTTAPMPVLAVTRIECTATARRCTPNESPRGVSMLGIGFGRPSSTEPNDDHAQGRLDKNAFLNVAAVGGDASNVAPLRRGYIVTRQGVHIGLTADNTRGDFAYVKLAPAASGRDWAPLPACISINGATPAACGSLLMDTGVTTMYMTVPDDQAPPDSRTRDGRSPTLRAGTQIAISVPAEEKKAIARYTFKLGDDGNPLAPAHLVLVDRARAPFVNTSVRFLNGFDYLYDADGGYVGLRWTGRAAPAIGKVVPSAVSPSN